MTWLVAVAQRRGHEMRRGLLDNLVLVVAVVLLFVALYLAASGVAGASVDDSKWSSLAVGYVTFLLLQQSLQAFNGYVNGAAATGLLEVLALSRPGLVRVLGAEFACQSALELARVAVALAVIVAVTGQSIEADVPALSVVLLPMMASVAGVGLAMAGATLAFKRTSGLAAILSFGLLALIAAPVDRVVALRLLPVADGSFLLRAVVNGESLGVVRVLGVWANGAVYLALGVVAFAWFERVAKDRGALAHA